MTAPGSKPYSEGDIPSDDSVVESRETGGDPAAEGSDAPSTTGTGVSDKFVGRVSGQDEGYAGETGAERRQAAQKD